MSCVATDNAWGPWAGPSCRGGLDFTLTFEESILTILPAGLLILAAALQIAFLLGRPRLAVNGILLWLKQALLIALGLLKLAVLMLWALPGSTAPRTKLTLAAAAVNVVVVIPLSVLSYFEHAFRVAPSFIIELYLLLTLLFDIIRVRTLWLMPTPSHTQLAAAETVALVVKVILSLAEAAKKDQLVFPDVKEKYTKEQLSGFYGRSMFFWLGSTLWNGYTRYLVPSDLSGPRDDEAAELLRERFRAQWAQNLNKTAKSALLTTLFRSMPGKFLIPVFPRATIVALTLTQPMLLERMITFVQGGGYEQRMDVGYALIGAFAVLYTLMALFNAWYAHACNKLALEMRSQLVDSCYRKLLKMRLAALDSGKAATLINVDMQHIMEGSKILHDIWASFVTVAVAVYLLYRKIQLACMDSPRSCLVMMILAGICSAPLGPRQVAWLAATESRVKSTMFMITGFKEVKMLGLAPDYTQSLQKLRLNEVNLGRRFRRILSIIITLSAASTELSILVAFGGFAIISKLYGTPLTFQTLFASLALLRISLDPLFLLIQGTPALVSMFKCLGRVQDLLNEERVVDSHSTPLVISGNSSASSFTLKPERRVTMEEFHAIFPQGPGLPDISPRHSTMADLVEILDASFCWKDKDQTPALYIMSLTIHPNSFTAVIGPVGSGKSTVLKAILGELEHISGSRQMRRGLKVAFCDQEPWLLDQTLKENIVGPRPFDPDWYERVIDACALAQDITGFSEGDAAPVGSGGSALSGGQKSRVALARAVYSKPELLLMDDIFSGLDRKSATHIFSAVFSENGLLAKLNCAAVLVTHSTQFLPRFDTILVVNNGMIAHQGTYDELLVNGALDDSILSRVSTPKAATSAGDVVEVTSDGKVVLKNAPLDKEENQASRAPSEWAVYGYFLKSCGVAGITLFFVLAAILAGERSFETVWLKMWAEGDQKALGYYMGVFTGLIVGGVSLLGGICVASISYVITVGSNTLANRFIQDIMLVDDELPMALVNTTTSFFGVLAETIIVMISSKYVSVSIPVLIIILWVIQKFYLRTSKQLRLMDIEAKAPLSSFLLETLQGIVSIRAFDRTNEFSSRNSELLNYSQRAHYMMVSVQVWLKMILDFVVTLLAILVTTLAVTFKSSTSLGFLGLALVNLISLSTSFKYLITFWANLETSIGAVARIRRFNMDVEPEEKFALPSPHPNWPRQGGIELQHVSASYRFLPPAVYGVNLYIAPGTKVAICGRSGSGKSSLLATLLRCLDLYSGSVIIDGLDISRISRDSLRKRIMTLPQKSLFIHDSIRNNMIMWDKDVVASRTPEEIDALIESLLRREEKKKAEENAPVTLDSPLKPEERLSIGQQQLFCLARALFQRGDSQIVLMDEFTSSMDHETEMLVREIVARDLRGKTVIEVLHRLEHILDFDLVVVLEQGRVVEAGHPEELLQDEEGMLRGLYQSMRG
ncbi:P-loop containing nucleoside triphosphate hydrolase protein [Corynascus novoguineensis]|uniref:P-loop containing nucleoside triphosphate hydrolase protein n=1 Tax=Corynascus novoguineensis TaxID=1126955 RepID=A0AAN7HM47_9PEZI|nr:P-loop containing nucleoside triphosphate hydrolase protein [Corynascus novoguineensis]